MKISQTKGYKKPLYALGITAALLTVSVTGCGGPIGYAGGMDIVTKETEEVVLGGDVAIIDETVETTACCKQDDDEVALDGDTELPAIEETPPMLEGSIEVVVPTE